MTTAYHSLPQLSTVYHININMREFNLSTIFTSLSPELPTRHSSSSSNVRCAKFWKSPRKEKSLLKSGGVLMCNNLRDAEELSSLISSKVRSLKTVENVYVRDISTWSRILLRCDSSPANTVILADDDTYAEVFDSLNVETNSVSSLNTETAESTETPPPLPSRRSAPKPPARPPYPSTLIQRRQRDSRSI